MDDALAVARSVTNASNMLTDDIGDIPALERCIDRLDGYQLTSPVSAACNAMRHEALQLRSAVWLQKQMMDQMKSVGRDALIGRGAAMHGEHLEDRADKARAAAEEVRVVIRRVAAELERTQLDG
jgi:hypothetical protein